MLSVRSFARTPLEAPDNIRSTAYRPPSWLPTMNQAQPTLFGHPAGLYTLFFAEMWERFSFYGMRALLLFYMIKGFLGYGDSEAYAVYGAYTALVYLTPFFGGLLADRLLGARRAVILGGLLMAAGHLTMTVQNDIAFFTALALLICGNGFFKPNISTMVGAQYAAGSTRRDAGFTLFYMGINLGAAMSPLLCGYIGETYGWHYGFGLATIGMLVGLAVFVVPRRITQGLILAGVVAAALGLFVFRPDSGIQVAINVFVGLALLAAGGIAVWALGRGGLASTAGAPPDMKRLRGRVLGGLLNREWAVYAGTLVAIPVVVLFVSASAVAGVVLIVAGVIAFGYLLMESFKLDKVARERMFVVLILTFFSLTFWAFFEQGGSSINNFTDRNVDRVAEQRTIAAADVGSVIDIQPTQEQLGHYNGDALFTLDALTALREANEGNPSFAIEWQVVQSNIGMGVGERLAETPASVYQSFNPVYILLFGLAFTALWGFLGARHREPPTPYKFALGLLQLGLDFASFWYGAQVSDERGMVALQWLAIGYLLHTTGELCLSPVGLSMVTKLAPARLVSTVMGAWFLATAFSQFLAAIIAQFTGVANAGDADGGVPAPIDTVHVYGDVFGSVAVMAVVAAAVCFLLSPLLTRWMHMDDED